MPEPATDKQARIYQERAEAYDELISAEDVDGRLTPAVTERVPLAGMRIADIGAGTGRLARLFAAQAAHMHLIDRAAARPSLWRAATRSRKTVTAAFRHTCSICTN